MSYILDALRRADADRQAGQVPGLHAHVEAAAPPPARSPQAAWLVAALLLALLGGAAAWWWWPRSATPVQPSPAAIAQPPAAAPPVAAAPAAQPAPLPMVISAPNPAPAPAPTARETAPPPAAVVPSPAPGVASAPAASRAVPLAELQPAQRRELPPLAVGGSVWSDNAPSRFVILDGQVLREGDALAPGLVLERIQRKSVILRWRDQRLEVPL